MAIDQIHDLQRTYRKILTSMSRPGTISPLEEEAKSIDLHVPCNNAALLCALTLLDAEVTFCVLPQSSPRSRELTEKIGAYTLASSAPAEQADFIIALNELDEEEWIQALAGCKTGSLADPQTSASWIIECGQLAEEREFVLSGPGIRHEIYFSAGLPAAVWQKRNERIEFPTGIDWIFADDEGNIACVPRSTAAAEMEAD